MPSTILSVSITEEQKQFLEDNPDMSPSKMFQAKINECIEFQKGGMIKLQKLEEANQRISQHRDQAVAFIESAGLLDKFMLLTEKSKNGTQT